MALKVGDRIAAYEVLSAIGAGGMGQVYRARDTRLNRDVALKVLLEDFSQDPDRRSRFEREAQLLAALNHSNIASIYGIEETDGRQTLVMEFVDGPTLADRLAGGPLPIDEALVVARQIGEALEFAHERGIIHRDLKPANVKLTGDGKVKLLDFGLAKALDDTTVFADAAHSPTLSLGATKQGVIFGTAAFMAPEQARGQPVDRRADIWAFGCVLFEMLTGKQVFAGDTVSDTLAAVLRADPPWNELPRDTPAALQRLLRRCLQKDPKRRLQHIGDARLELDESAAGVSEPQFADRRKPRWIWPSVVAAAGVAVMAGVTGWRLAPDRAPALVRRYTIPFPVTGISNSGVFVNVVLSPDGRTLVFSTGTSGLLTRRTDALAFEPLRGAEAGVNPFFSPDGAWIGFHADGKLKKIPAEGGLAVTICDAPGDLVNAAWGDDGSIIVTSGGGLYRVPSSGGTLQLILEPDANGGFGQPRVLPGSTAVLVRVGNTAAARIEAIDVTTRQRHRLVDGTTPQVAATGDLIFEQRGGLWAVKFDPTRLLVEGAPVPLVQGIRLGPGNRALYSAAGDGSLVYIAGAGDLNRSLVWIDRAGKATVALEARASFQSPRLSPNGKAVVVSVLDGSGLGLWWYEFERGSRLRLTTSGDSRRTVWSPDGTQVAFYAGPERGGDQDLYVMPSTGGAATRLLERPRLQYPDTWSPDGRFLVFEEAESSGAGRRDLWLLPIGEAPRPLLVTPFNERGAVFSPDGRWLAFVTDESGRAEVYVQPFPGPGPKVPISNNGGIQPMWSRNGRELFYRERDTLMSVSFQIDPFRVAAPRILFELPGATYNLDQNFADYDVAPDGRFLAMRAESTEEADVHVVLNWTEELRRVLGR